MGMTRGLSSTAPVGDHPPSLLDVAELAERLRVTERFVRRLVDERRIPFLKVGKFIRFDPEEISKWIDDKRVAPR